MICLPCPGIHHFLQAPMVGPITCRIYNDYYNSEDYTNQRILTANEIAYHAQAFL